MSAASEPTGAATASVSSSSAPPALPPGFVRAAARDEIPDGGLLGALVAGRRLCLTRVGDAVTALADACTHAEFSLSAGELCPDGSVECAWHGARFDRATGAVVQGPACEPVQSHAVLLHDGDVYVRLDA